MAAGNDSPHNDASRSVFEKLGLARDVGADARPFADESRDLGMAIDRATFQRVNAAARAQLAMASIA